MKKSGSIAKKAKEETGRNHAFNSSLFYLMAKGLSAAWMSFTGDRIDRKIIFKFFSSKKLRLDHRSDSAKGLETDLANLFPQHY
jgi:hypothetical protein